MYRIKDFELTIDELIDAKRRGYRVYKASPIGMTREEYRTTYGRVYKIEGHRVLVKGTTEEIERRLKEARR